MDLGIQIEPQFGYRYEDVVEISESALDSGFRKVWFSDHFMLNKDATDRVLLDPWLTMAALVRENQNIHVGSLVFCNSYRNPALHAKMGATLDVLSEGRFDFGFGAGWKEIEYEAYGYRYAPNHERIDQFIEAIQIVRGAWTERVFSFQGTHYQVKDLISYPKPVQTPHPPIIVGTMYGRRRMVDTAARYGDGINLAWAFGHSQAKAIFDRIETIQRSLGRDRGRFRHTLGYWSSVFDSDDEIEDAIAKGAKERGIGTEEYGHRVASAMWGTPESIKERLLECRRLGVSDVILMLPYGREKEQMQKLSSVAASLR
jgi:alkanesulfonate monooxygenase SsuD/methylene tetrahydromethanopterin reductase-like flavin-dependent oxidoreductase (luciferase family)